MKIRYPPSLPKPQGATGAGWGGWACVRAKVSDCPADLLPFPDNAERGPALTQTPAVLSERLERPEGGKQGHGEDSTQTEVRSFLPAWGGRWNDTKLWLYLGDSRGRACGCPYSWPLTARSLSFPPAKVLQILGMSGKCSQPKGWTWSTWKASMTSEFRARLWWKDIISGKDLLPNPEKKKMCWGSMAAD